MMKPAKIDDASSAKEVSASVSSGSSAVSVTANGTTKNADGVEVTDYAVDLSQATKDDIQKVLMRILPLPIKD